MITIKTIEKAISTVMGENTNYTFGERRNAFSAISKANGHGELQHLGSDGYCLDMMFFDCFGDVVKAFIKLGWI